MLTSAQLAKLEAPEGWAFSPRPSLRAGGSIAMVSPSGVEPATKLRLLYRWAEANKLGLKKHLTTRVRHPREGYNYHLATTFKVYANKPEMLPSRTGKFEKFCCGETASAGAVYCETCYNPLICGICNHAGVMLHRIQTVPGNTYDACAECSKKCEKCAGRVPRDGGAVLCGKCAPMQRCMNCSQYGSEKDFTPDAFAQRESDWLCKLCAPKFSCPQCKLTSMRRRPVLNKRLGVVECTDCSDKRMDQERKAYERLDEHETPMSGNLRFPAPPERPFRIISVETEFDGDGEYAARTLYRCGIVPSDSVGGYHQAPGEPDSEHVGLLKRDGSVSGGELVTHLLDLSDRDHADALYEVMTKLTGLKKMKKIAFNSNAGGHIHIDVHNFDMADAWRLTTIYNYLENTIYHLAGAGCSYGHRTLDPDHDRNNRDQGFARPIVKGPFGTQSNFGLQMQAQGRMCGLNFQHFLQARRHCQCGAWDYGKPKDCTCTLGKATIEWRVWNSTCNPRILHGWIALMQAMTAYADRDEDVTKTFEEKFPAFPWDTKSPVGRTEPYLQQHRERLEWLHSSLPLTEAERDSLIYCAKQSQLGTVLGSAYLDGLALLPNAAEVTAKTKYRGPVRRERKILLKPPTPGALPKKKKSARAEAEWALRNATATFRRSSTRSTDLPPPMSAPPSTPTMSAPGASLSGSFVIDDVDDNF